MARFARLVSPLLPFEPLEFIRYRLPLHERGQSISQRYIGLVFQISISTCKANQDVTGKNNFTISTHETDGTGPPGVITGTYCLRRFEKKTDDTSIRRPSRFFNGSSGALGRIQSLSRLRLVFLRLRRRHRQRRLYRSVTYPTQRDFAVRLPRKTGNEFSQIPRI